MQALMSTGSFFETLEQTSLLDANQLQAARQAAGADPEALAHYLISQELLTPWQVAQIRQGVNELMVDKYELIDLLGVGGMGAVYKVRERGIGRIAALKLLSEEEVARNPQAVARFRREVLASAALNHPHIVAAHAADQIEDKHFLVMEYVDGRSLKDWIKRERNLPIDWSCECVRQAALALDHAHTRGLVHRDVKPSNMLVVGSSTATRPLLKILDFGLVRLVSDEWQGRHLTAADQVLGTPDYISPEQAYDPRSADVRSDIYSLGCTLFHMLTGTVPFNGNTPVEKLMARAGRDAPRVQSLRPEVPDGLDAVVAKMLAHDPARRYQRPSEAAQALAPFGMRRATPIEQADVDEAPTNGHDTAPVARIMGATAHSEPVLVGRDTETSVGDATVGPEHLPLAAANTRVIYRIPAWFWLLFLVSLGASFAGGYFAGRGLPEEITVAGQQP